MIKILVTTDTEQTEYIIRAMSTEKQTELLEDLRICREKSWTMFLARRTRISTFRS